MTAKLLRLVRLKYGEDPAVVEGAEVGASTKAKVAVFVTGARRNIIRRVEALVLTLVVPFAG